MKFRFEDSKTKVTGYNNNAVIYATVYGTLAVSVDVGSTAKEVVNEILTTISSAVKIEGTQIGSDGHDDYVLYHIKATASLPWNANSTKDSEDPTETAIEKARGKAYTFLEKFITLLDKHMPYFLNSHEPMKIELPAAVYRDIINKLNK